MPPTRSPHAPTALAPSSIRRPGQPLLSLTIPTFNRSAFLAELLEALLPQFAAIAPGEAELLVSDNCSDDDTPAVLASFQARGLPCRVLRNESNIGADANFLQCLREASGQYVWVMGDDDLLVPNALPDLLSLLRQEEVDLVYLSSFSFSGSLDMAALDTPGHPDTRDRLGRYAEIVSDGPYFLEKANALLGLISVMLVNKNRLFSAPFPPPEDLADTNLVQMGWIFPLLRRRCCVLYVWRRLIAYRAYNSGGWGVCEVFGIRLERIAREYFANDPALARALMKGVLRYWLFDAILEMRRGRHAAMNAENFAHDIRPLFSRSPAYWIFVYPAAEFPLPLAEAVHFVLSRFNKLSRMAHGMFRHWFRHGRYLQP